MRTQKMSLIIAGLSLLSILTLLSACEPAAASQVEVISAATVTSITTTEPTSRQPSPAPEQENNPATAKPLPTVVEETSPEEEIPAPPLALTDGFLITATSTDPVSDGTIVIEDGIITAIGATDEIDIPEGAEVIDVEGRTIMPGLIDARASTLLNRLEPSNGQLDVLAVELYLRAPLKQGVTTLRAVGWDWEKQENIEEMRAALESYGNSIPTVLISGSTITHSEGDAITVYYPNEMVGVIAVEDARETTERQIDLGVDQINLVMTLTKDSTATEADPSNPTLSAEQLQAIVEVAHGHGKRVIAQTIFHEDAEAVVEAGVDELMVWPVQGLHISDDLIANLVENSIPVMTGFSVGQVRPQEGDIRRFLDAGGTLVYGTFAPNSGGNPEKETRLMFLNDMTPAEILAAATVNAAEALELDDMIGTLEVGKRADILVLDGNPLEDVRAYRNVVYVINNGELVIKPETE